MDQEYWKDIIGYEGLYSISNLGRIWNHNFQKYMKARLCKRNGYMKIGLTKDSKQTMFSVHRLVAIAHIPNPENKKEVNHKDLIKTNNNVNNLEWVTPMENIDWNRVNNNFNSVFTVEQVKYILTLLKNNPKLNLSKLSRETGWSRSGMSCIKNKKTWKHVKLEE